MKVKQLRQFLVKLDDDVEVVVNDIEGQCLAISGLSCCYPVAYIDVRQTFPESWYDENGEEIDGRKFNLVTNDTVNDIELADDVLIGRVITVRLSIHDGYAEGNGVRVEYPKLSELTPAQIDEIDEYIGGRINDSGYVTPEDVLLKFGKIVRFVGLMDTTNGHDKTLVRRINAAWAESKESFRPVLCALYDRDVWEIYNSDAFAWPEAADTDYVYSEMSNNWEMYAYDYLMHVADDTDLEAILNFLHK